MYSIKFKFYYILFFFEKELFNNNLDIIFCSTCKTLGREFTDRLPPGGIDAK
jgi:hypothetical protein